MVIMENPLFIIGMGSEVGALSGGRSRPHPPPPPVPLQSRRPGVTSRLARSRLPSPAALKSCALPPAAFRPLLLPPLGPGPSCLPSPTSPS